MALINIIPHESGAIPKSTLRSSIIMQTYVSTS